MALGVPLSYSAKNESIAAPLSATSLQKYESAASDASLSTSDTTNNESDYAQRARNSAARIYARRVIDRNRLERQHPWASAAEVQNGEKNDDDNNNNFMSNTAKMFDDAQSKLLTETLVSLIEMKEQLGKVQAISNSYVGNTFSAHGRNSILQQLGVNLENMSTKSFASYNNNSTAIAACETSLGFRDRYNAIDNTETARKVALNAESTSKPAEWGDDSINLAERRQQFGQEISPLSNTTMLQRWGMAVKRLVTLGTLAAPLGVMVPATAILGGLAGNPGTQKEDETTEKNLPMLQRYHQKLSQSTWDYALWAIESAGPTYIKLVQWASTRNDLFSPEFVGHFSKLQDETRGHSWRETELCLERAYGKEWRKVLSFDRVIEDDEDESDGAEGKRLKRTGGAANRERQKRLERQETKSSRKAGGGGGVAPTIPIGSGCVAQVYKARLCSSHGLHKAGTSVAVKVQHPRILEKVCLDFYLLNKFASFLEYIPYLNLDYLSMKDSVDQFRDIMLPQLDLRVEAHNLQRFRRDFDGETQINFPEPLVELTNREVLVEKFVEGEPMLNFVLKEDETHSKEDREELARIGLETVMKMIFLNDFIHADLVSGQLTFLYYLFLMNLLPPHIIVSSSSTAPWKYDCRSQHVSTWKSTAHSHDRLWLNCGVR